MVIYREYAESDLPSICKVLQAAFNIYAQINFSPEYIKELREVDDGIRKGTIYVAEVNDNIVSVAMIVRRELSLYPSFLPTAGIANVGTMPGYRGRGLARNLLTYALRDLREKGYSASALFVSYGVPAHRIYRRLGFYDVVIYNNRVCVLENIDHAVKWLESRLENHAPRTNIEVLSEPWREGVEGNFKLLYYRFINKKYRGSTYRSIERWRGILSKNPFETWFLGDPSDKIIIHTNGGVHGYSIMYYMKDSILARSHDIGLGVVTEIVTRDLDEADAILIATFKKALEDNIRTLTFRPPPDLDEYLPVCRVLGSPETFMFKILDPEKFVSDTYRFFSSRPVDSGLEVLVKGKEHIYKLMLGDGRAEVRYVTSPGDASIIIDEGALIRMLMATMTAYDEYKLGRIIVKEPNTKKILELLNNVFKGRRRHYLSLIDKW